jgi:ATP-dependent DNA helicase RecQ
MFVVERDDLYRLRGNSPEEDRIIDCLLRNYTGLFNSYSYIDEAFLAQETALSKPVVYQQLKGLAQKHIISFIPQKRIPFIRYRQRREDSEHLLFPPHVYDDLRHRYSQRIEAMIAYATTGNQCRSRQLLRYFGETSSKECGQCDVCIERSRQLKTADALRQAETAILSLLSDGQPHPITSLRNITLPIETIDAAIRQLVDEGRVIDDDGLLSRS